MCGVWILPRRRREPMSDWFQFAKVFQEFLVAVNCFLLGPVPVKMKLFFLGEALPPLTLPALFLDPPATGNRGGYEMVFRLTPNVSPLQPFHWITTFGHHHHHRRRKAITDRPATILGAVTLPALIVLLVERGLG